MSCNGESMGEAMGTEFVALSHETPSPLVPPLIPIV